MVVEKNGRKGCGSIREVNHGKITGAQMSQMAEIKRAKIGSYLFGKRMTTTKLSDGYGKEPAARKAGLRITFECLPISSHAMTF